MRTAVSSLIYTYYSPNKRKSRKIGLRPPRPKNLERVTTHFTTLCKTSIFQLARNVYFSTCMALLAILFASHGVPTFDPLPPLDNITTTDVPRAQHRPEVIHQMPKIERRFKIECHFSQYIRRPSGSNDLNNLSLFCTLYTCHDTLRVKTNKNRTT